MCVLSIKVAIRKSPGNLFNDPRMMLNSDCYRGILETFKCGPKSSGSFKNYLQNVYKSYIYIYIYIYIYKQGLALNKLQKSPTCLVCFIWIF